MSATSPVVPAAMLVPRYGFRLEEASDPGSVTAPENLRILIPTKHGLILGQLDGTTGWCGPGGPRWRDGLTRSQALVLEVERCLRDLRGSVDARGIVSVVPQLNSMVHEWQTAQGFDLSNPSTAPAVSGALWYLCFAEMQFEGAAWGNCVLLWQLLGEEPCASIAQIEPHEEHMRSLYESLLDHNKGDQGETWSEYAPEANRWRNLRTNNPAEPLNFGALNGQPEFNNMFQSVGPFDVRGAQFLVAATEGLFSIGTLRHKRAVVAHVAGKSLATVLHKTRELEDVGLRHPHVDCAEASAVGLFRQG